MTESIPPIGASPPTGPILPEAFDDFVGDTFFRQMLKSLRSTTGKPAYFHGGQAEEIFQSQMDELLIENLTKATRDSFSGDLFKQQFPNHVPASSIGQSTDAERHALPTEIPVQPAQPGSTQSKFDKNA
jgi:hypothetical protein